MGQEHSAPSSCSSSSTSSGGPPGPSPSCPGSRASLSSEARLQLYTNVHYRDPNNNHLYRPLKLKPGRLHRLKLLDADRETADYLEKHLSIKSYLDQGDRKKGPELPEPPQKKGGNIRNYTPKILSDKQPQKELEQWI